MRWMYYEYAQPSSSTSCTFLQADIWDGVLSKLSHFNPFLTEYEAALLLAVPLLLYVLQPRLREKIHTSTSSTPNSPY